jgi:hypothetical protein
MGRVLKTVAVIAVAAAIAYFAPTLGLQLAQLAIPGAVAGGIAAGIGAAVVAATLSAVAGLAFQAISASPADAPSGIRRATIQRDASGLELVEVQPSTPELIDLAPIEPRHWWHAYFFPGQRYDVIRLVGDCMDGLVAKNARWALISRDNVIRPGDLFAFDLDDLWRTYSPNMRWRWWHRVTSVGMVKRYLGQEAGWDRIIFDCTNPPTICETGRNHVRHAYRVVSLHPSPWGAWRARWKLSPALHRTASRPRSA